MHSFRASDGNRGINGACGHLIAKELLVGQHFLSPLLFSLAKLFVFFVGALDPPVHVGLVGSCIVLFAQALLPHLIGQHLVELLMLQALLILPVNVLQARLVVLLQTLLDVLLLLLKLKLFSVVSDDVSHAIHNGLDSFTPIGHFFLTRLLFL